MEHLKLMVCPHDTAKDPDKWFAFASYLSQQSGLSIQYLQCIDFVEFHQKMENADIIYANPQDSLSLVEQFGYIPLVHSSNLFDEIVYIGGSQADSQELGQLHQAHCVSCNSMMVTRVGLKALFEKQISPDIIHNKESWLAVVTAVYKGEIPYGFVYKDFYDGLNKLSKSLIQKLGESNEQSVFHSVFISPALAEKQQLFSNILLQSHQDGLGREILTRLNIEQFVKTNTDEIKAFKYLSQLGNDIIQSA